MDSSKKKVKVVPFQTLTRNRSQVLTAEVPKEIKVELNKMNQTQLSTSKKNTSPKFKIQAGPVKPKNTSAVSKKRSLSLSSKKSENLDLLNTLSVAPTCEIEVIDLSSSSVLTGKNTSTTCIQPISSVKKRKYEKLVPPTKTRVRKLKQNDSGTINKKTFKVSSSKKAANKQAKIQLKSGVSPFVPVKVCKGSKNCGGCSGKEENINLLHCRIRELEEKEASMQNRLSIYEGLGLSHLQKEEENKTLIKKKEILQKKLSNLEEELYNYHEEEDEEIRSLLHKKNTLKRNLKIKMKESEKHEDEEEKELKKTREITADFEVSEAKDRIEVNALLEEISVLEKKVAEEKEKLKLKPKELPTEKQIQGPCEICKKIIEEKITSKKICQDAEIEESALRKELRELLAQVLEGAVEVTVLSYEVEYMKTRIRNERDYHHTVDWHKQIACFMDYYRREEYTEKLWKLLDKHFHTKKYEPEPTAVYALPKSRVELEMIESAKDDGLDLCCQRFPKRHCRYVCGREGHNMTKEERIKYETSEPGLLEIAVYPGRIETEEGKLQHINYLMRNQIYEYPLTKE